MIRSYVRNAFFIVRPLHGPASNRRWRRNPVAGQRCCRSVGRPAARTSVQDGDGKGLLAAAQHTEYWRFPV